MAVITMSRGTFSGGERLARCVAEKLGHRCVSRAVVHEAGLQYGVSEEQLSKAMSQPPGLFERLGPERARYLACIRAILVREAHDDNLVYHVLAGHFLLDKVPNILRVRVIADMEFRIKLAMERNKLGREDAIRYIKRLDEEREKWTRFIYHFDWGDPLLYDLVINLDRISLDSACEMVCHTARLAEFTRTAESQKIVNDMVLSTEIMAILATTRGLASTGVEVEADNGVVTLSGAVASLQDADGIRQIVRKVPGVYRVDSKMKVGATW